MSRAMLQACQCMIFLIACIRVSLTSCLIRDACLSLDDIHFFLSNRDLPRKEFFVFRLRPNYDSFKDRFKKIHE